MAKDKSILTILDQWPSDSEVAADLGIKSTSEVVAFRRRGRMPVKYWQSAVDSARKRGIRGVNLSSLYRIWLGTSQSREARERVAS